MRQLSPWWEGTRYGYGTSWQVSGRVNAFANGDFPSLIAGPAGTEHEEIIYAEANLADARRKRNWNEYNQVLRDRRTDVYNEMLGTKVSLGWY